MTGDLDVYGAQMREGAKLAVADINAAGGVLGKPLRLIVQDDECAPSRATSVARNVVSQNVVAVIGHFCSGVSIPASAVYAESGVLQITPSSSNPNLTEQAFHRGWKTVFRSYVRDDHLGFAAASYLAEHYPKGRIALLQDDSNYASTIERPLLRGLVAYGIEPVFQDQIDAGHSSYQDTIDELIKARPDAIYYMGYYPEAALLVKEARASGLQAAFFGSDSLMTTDFAEAAGSAADGVMFIANQGAQAVPEGAALLARLHAQGADADPTGEDYAVFTYAAFQEFALAAQQAGTTEAAAVAKALRSGSFETVMGTMAFDEKGDLRDERFSWYRFRAGSYELVP